MTSLRYALRSLKKSPAFVAISVLALGIGLGMSTTMFAVMDAVLNPHVSYREPERLFHMNAWFGRRSPMTRTELYAYVRNNTRSFEAFVPSQFDRATIEINGNLEEVFGRRVGWRWFDIVGVRPAVGRSFRSSDQGNVAVISDELWKRAFGRRRSLEGMTIRIGEATHAIIGVLPAGARENGFVVPMDSGGEIGMFRPLVRLRVGVTREQADAELKQISRSLTERYGAQDAPFAFEMYPLLDRREDIRDIHKAMVGSALAVLLIACVNLAHLMMARGMAKRRELALRMALGASRGVVVRQMFLECLLITAAGALLGGLLTVWGADILRNRVPREVTWIGFVQPQLSWRVFAASAMAAAVSAILFGLIPSLRVVLGVSLDDPLKDDSGTTTGRVRYRYNPLVAAEVGLALVLMMGGALLLRTVYQLSTADPGFNTRTLYSGWVGSLRTSRQRSVLSRNAILTAARSTPGVIGVAMEGGRQTTGRMITAEMSGDSNRTIMMPYIPAVTHEFLALVELPILEGRGLTAADEFGTGVVVIDNIAAQRLYPNQSAVGKMVKLGTPQSNAPWLEIVGIIRSPTWGRELGDATRAPTVFASLTGSDSVTNGRLLIRTERDDPSIVTALQTRLRDLPGVAAASVYPFDYQRVSELRSRGFLAKLFVAMGGVALGLAALGLYGVLAYSVGRRMREFAVRLALGCEPKQLKRMVLHDGFVMLLLGIGIGAFFALAASRWLDAVLVAILPSDVISLVACEIVLFAVGLAAALAPARRAARANPLDILRAS